MIAVARHTRNRRPAPAWHAEFLAMLPVILAYARIAFRRADPELKGELVQAVVVNCLVAFIRLIELGKGDLAFASVLAKYGIAQVRQGRRVGSRLNVHDALSGYAQHRKGFSITTLDHYDNEEGAWQEILIEDHRCTPAELAASRIDFADWLKRLPSRQRRIAKVLATGERTGAVAKRFGVTPARISQVRDELKVSWLSFQGEVKPSTRSVCAAA